MNNTRVTSGGIGTLPLKIQLQDRSKVCAFLFYQILKRGCHVNDRDGLTDMTLLHYSCKAGAHGVGEA